MERKWTVRSLALCAAAMWLVIVVWLAETQADTRIINGYAVANGAYPWMGSLSTAGSDPADPVEGHFCGAALIAPSYVVTAAHCVEGFNGYPELLQVAVGRTKLTSSSGTIATVAGIAIHPNYDPARLRNDIALIHLAAPVPYSPVALIGANDAALWTPGTHSTILGWGTTDPNFPVLPDNLQGATVPIQSDQTCENDLGLFYSSQAHLCAGILATSATSGDGVDSCFGDSGGPLVVPNGSSLKIAGLASWGFGCASPRFYGVYTRVANYSAWAYSFPPAPPYERAPADIQVDGDNPMVGNTAHCINAAWAGENLQYSYRWYRQGLSSQPAILIDGASLDSYVLQNADVDNYIYCSVTASNSSGSLESVSWQIGTVVPAIGPTPDPTIEIKDITAPKVSKGSVHCTGRKCRIDVRVLDDQSDVAGVEGAVFLKSNLCTNVNGTSVCQSLTDTSILYASRRANNMWRFSFRARHRGLGSLLAIARDTSGNINTHPKTIRFRVK